MNLLIFFFHFYPFLVWGSFKLWPHILSSFCFHFPPELQYNVRFSYFSSFFPLGCPEVETECNGNWWTANWSYLFMHGKASTSPGTKSSSNLIILFADVLYHGHVARSAKNIHVRTCIVWSQKMLWALSYCHITIYHLWCGYAHSLFSKFFLVSSFNF